VIAKVRLWGRTIGAVSLQEGRDFAAFQYDREFAASGIKLAPLVMPLSERVCAFPALPLNTFYGLPGLLADSLPDKFGNALIDAWLATQGRTANRFGAIERLCYTGTRGMGKLEFEPIVGPKPHKAATIKVNALVRLAGEVFTHRADLHGPSGCDQSALGANSMKMKRRTSIQTAFGALVLCGTGQWAMAVTPAQTKGPFFPKIDQADKDLDMTIVEGHSERALGEVVDVHGQVVDEKGAPVGNALIDVWQANHHGRYAHEADSSSAAIDPHFQGWSQFRTDAQGRYRFRTIKPGAYAVSNDWSRPPHIHFKVALRGYYELTTQMYFGGHKLNDVDRLLLSVPEAQRGSLVVAFNKIAGEASGIPKGQFNLVLRKV